MRFGLHPSTTWGEGLLPCTAGRAAFITGQTRFRTGLLKVGMPAAKQGLQDSDPTIAKLLKPLGYTSAQIGKNHLRPVRRPARSAWKGADDVARGNLEELIVG